MRLFIFILCLWLAANTAHATLPTVIDDQVEADKLLGEHLFARYDLAVEEYSTWKNFGKAVIKNNDGVYHIEAEHENYYPAYRAEDIVKGGYIRIKGDITRIGNDYFWIDGQVDYYGKNESRRALNQGQYPDMTCSKKGYFLFSRKGHDAYWRLQNDRGICSPQDDPDYVVEGDKSWNWRSRFYADIFTAQLTE